jgi:hypothetical protein
MRLEQIKDDKLKAIIQELTNLESVRSIPCTATRKAL